MRILAVLLLFIGFAGFGQEKGTSGDVTLFTVETSKKGKIYSPVTTREFIYLYKKNHGKKDDFTEAKENDYLNLLVNFKLKVTEAVSRRLDTTAAFRKEFSGYREELKKPYLAADDDLDRLTKEAYENLKSEVLASHILVAVKPDAVPADTVVALAKINAIRKRALAGEDFEKLVRETSEDPSSKSNGGSLGYFTGFQMVYPFEKVAFATQVGLVSPVLRTRFGYHILKVFDRIPSRGEVEVSHILLRTNGTNDAKIKNRAFEIFDQIKANRPWDELARDFSEDPNTKNSGGRLKPFGPKVYATIPEFEQAAFSLKNPGDVSDPFQSKVGWHIVRLEKKIPLPPYSEMEASLKRKVARDERLQFSKANQLQKRKDAVGFKEDAQVRAHLLSYDDPSVVQGNWNYTGLPNHGDAAHYVLFTAGNTATYLPEFRSYVNAHPSAKTTEPLPYLRQLYTNFTEERLAAAEEALIVVKHPEYQMLLNEYYEGILLFEIMEKEVWNRASEDTVGQRKYFAAHLDKFKAGDRIEARIFSTPDKNFFQLIREKIAKGDSINAGDMKQFKSVQHKRTWERGESKIVDRINWVPGVQETEADGIYYLVDVIRLIAPGTKTFEEARAGIISDYQDQLEKEWLVQLRKKYPVKINKTAKKAVIAELNK